MTLTLADLTPVEKQYYLQHVIAPRPICLASTVNADGEVNLSPFSFFNMFSSNPPIIVFSPARRVRNNTIKHTLENVRQVPEVVVNIVTEEIVQQVSLASCEYPRGVNEFLKAGFTPVAATLVRPPCVKESKVNMECRVLEIKPLGQEGGAGNLVICEVLLMHIDDRLMDVNRRIDQRKIHHVARLGGDWYCRADADSLFLVEKPNTELGIGIDALPDSIRNSSILSGNDLGRLANVQEQPAIDPAFEDDHVRQIMQYYSLNPVEMERELHLHAKKLLQQDNVKGAWQVLLSS